MMADTVDFELDEDGIYRDKPQAGDQHSTTTYLGQQSGQINIITTGCCMYMNTFMTGYYMYFYLR